jgi:hypothetical protein
MQIPTKNAPSRLGKMQIIMFVDPHLAAHVNAKHQREGKTKQELIAEAANAMLALQDQAPILTGGHARTFKRKRNVSVARTNEQTPACRTGKVSIGGWFPIAEVQSLKDYVKTQKSSLQDFLILGMWEITGQQQVT